MKRCLEVAAFLGFISVAFFFTVAGIAAYRLSRQIEPLLTDTRRVVLSVGGTAADLRKIADAVKRQADAQSAAITQAAQGMAKATQALTSDLYGLSSTINNLNALIIAQRTPLDILERQAGETMVKAQGTLETATIALQSANNAIQDAQDVISDHHIQQSIENIDLTTASVERDSAMLETRLRQILKPASLAKRMFMWLLQTIPPVITAAK